MAELLQFVGDLRAVVLIWIVLMLVVSVAVVSIILDWQEKRRRKIVTQSRLRPIRPPPSPMPPVKRPRASREEIKGKKIKIN